MCRTRLTRRFPPREPMADVVAGEGVDGCGAVPESEVRLVREPGDVTDLDQQPGGAGRSDAEQVQQAGAGTARSSVSSWLAAFFEPAPHSGRARAARALTMSPAMVRFYSWARRLRLACVAVRRWPRPGGSSRRSRDNRHEPGASSASPFRPRRRARCGSVSTSRHRPHSVRVRFREPLPRPTLDVCALSQADSTAAEAWSSSR